MREPKSLDPFRSPPIEAEVVEEADRGLTRAERAVLELYYEHRDQRFTLGRLVWRMLPNWCAMAVFLAAIALLTYFIFPRESALTGYIFVGVCSALTGAVLRDIGVARRLVTIWPVLRDLFAWERVAARLGVKPQT